MASKDRNLFLQHSAAARAQGMSPARELLLLSVILSGFPRQSMLTFIGSGLVAGYGAAPITIAPGIFPVPRGRGEKKSRVLVFTTAGSFPCQVPVNFASGGRQAHSFSGLVRS